MRIAEERWAVSHRGVRRRAPTVTVSRFTPLGQGSTRSSSGRRRWPGGPWPADWRRRPDRGCPATRHTGAEVSSRATWRARRERASAITALRVQRSPMGRGIVAPLQSRAAISFRDGSVHTPRRQASWTPADRRCRAGPLGRPFAISGTSPRLRRRPDRRTRESARTGSMVVRRGPPGGR